MGGNALKNTQTRRYDKDEYFMLEREVSDKVDSLVYSDIISGYTLIPAYHNKESFGDMDILYSTKDDLPLDVDALRLIFPNTEEIIRNTNVISLEYKKFQVDFICVAEHQFDYALNYYSYNDCGNLVGKLAHRFGLKHGHAGLILPLRDGDNKFDEVVITLDHSEALRFLGLDDNTFRNGFDSLESIFDFVSNSPHYNPDDYKLENLSAAGRVRDKKRETYQKFLEYGKNWVGTCPPKADDKTIYLEEIFKAFPNAYDDYQIKVRELALQKFVKDKFNGDIVAELTGLKDKELGLFMRKLRDNFYFRPENIVYLSDAQLANNIKKSFEEFKGVNYKT